MSENGLEAIYLENRGSLLRFLRAHGAEELLNEFWFKISEGRPGPIAQPLAYLYRAANNLMLDRFRSDRQATLREREWAETTGPVERDRPEVPTGDHLMAGRQDLARAHATLAALGPRVEQVFRRHRLDGVPQRALAARTDWTPSCFSCGRLRPAASRPSHAR